MEVLLRFDYKSLKRHKQSNSVYIRIKKPSESRHSVQYIKANMDKHMIVDNIWCNCVFIYLFIYFATEFCYDI